MYSKPIRATMIYFLELENAYSHDIASIEADSESMLEELSARIKVAFSFPYDDYKNHEFNFRGHRYVPDDSVEQVREMQFETWEPNPEIPTEEPDWFELYQSSDIPLSEVFTVLGDSIVYSQGNGYKVRITLVDRKQEPAEDTRFEEYDHLQDEFD